MKQLLSHWTGSQDSKVALPVTNCTAVAHYQGHILVPARAGKPSPSHKYDIAQLTENTSGQKPALNTYNSYTLRANMASQK